MRALIIDCAAEPTPASANSKTLATVVADAMGEDGIIVDWIRVVQLSLAAGLVTDTGPGDDWPALRERLAASEILIIATPVRAGEPSPLALHLVRRMEAMATEIDLDDRPVGSRRVAGVVNTSKEDGTHHVIGEIANALGDLGYTIPGQVWTYCHLGSGISSGYLDEQQPDYGLAASTGRMMAASIVTVARALDASMAPRPSDLPPL